MNAMLVLACLWTAGAPAAPAAEEPRWEHKARSEGVNVFMRSRPNTDVKELKAIGLIESPPPAVFAVLVDFVGYKETMPYTDEAKIVATESGGKVTHFYSMINAPFVAKRDYTVRVVDESDWKDGKGYMKTTWTPSDKGPAPIDGVVRVGTNEGSWYLEPIDDGKHTRATYFLFTDPGGSLPTWIVNKANSSTIPDIYEALRKYSKEPKYAQKKP